MATNARKKMVRLGSNDRVAVVRKFSYDFGSEGGAVGAITLKGEDNNAEVIPAGAVITRAWTSARTAMTSGGAAPVALGYTGGAANIKAATAFNDATFVGVDAHTAAIPAAVGAADVSVLATVATAALTAGAFDVFVEYIPAEVPAEL